MKSESKYQFNEKALVEGLQRRDKSQLTALYRRYGAALYGIALRIVKSEVFAEEVIQDAFLKIWNNIERFDAKKGKLFTWMARIVRNEAIDKCRSSESNKGKKTDSIDQNVYTINSTYQTEIRVDDIGIRDLLQKLDPTESQILDLVYFQGFTHVQTAELLEKPLGTIKTKLRHAIIKLGAMLKEK